MLLLCVAKVPRGERRPSSLLSARPAELIPPFSALFDINQIAAVNAFCAHFCQHDFKRASFASTSVQT
jgi:hypothetical protein